LKGRLEWIDCVLVDDGSKWQRPLHETLQGKLRNLSVWVLCHPINQGQGAALQTGIQFARDQLNTDLFVTLDSDGQHRIEDLPAMIEKLDQEGADIVFGDRFAVSDGTQIPASRKVLLRLAIRFERLITGINLNDAHNGYRVFRRSFAEKLDLKQNRMAHATEFKQTVREYGFKYAECPVVILYSQETLAKGQKDLGFLSILKELMNVYLFQG
jgi:glycosyltransferase involved in cell wall biosynthesis